MWRRKENYTDFGKTVKNIGKKERRKEGRKQKQVQNKTKIIETMFICIRKKNKQWRKRNKISKERLKKIQPQGMFLLFLIDKEDIQSPCVFCLISPILQYNYGGMLDNPNQPVILTALKLRLVLVFGCEAGIWVAQAWHTGWLLPSWTQLPDPHVSLMTVLSLYLDPWHRANPLQFWVLNSIVPFPELQLISWPLLGMFKL